MNPEIYSQFEKFGETNLPEPLAMLTQVLSVD